MSRASTSLVATPSKAISNFLPNLQKPATPTTPIPPSPGTFRHPRLTEIIKRQSASSFTGPRLQNAIINTTAITTTLVLSDTLHKIIGTLLATASISPSVLNASNIIFLLRLLFLSNIVICLRPVLPYLSQKDEVTDILLTPSQRALIGLPPSDKASMASAGGSAAYITPPRYRHEGGINRSTSANNSPLGTSTGRRMSGNYASTSTTTPRNAGGYSPSTPSNQTPSLQTSRFASGSPFAGSLGGSSSIHRATSNEVPQFSTSAATDRTSFGTSTSSFGFGLGRSQSMRERKGGLEDGEGIPGTPSPSGPKRQPGVNYKWLYDKGSRLPRSESTGF